MNLVNFDRLSTWVKFKPSLCEGCRALCCFLPLEVNKEDLLRLGLVSEDEIQGSLKKTAKRLQSEGWVKSFRAATGLFILSQNNDGACVFLDKGSRCTVYEKRPKVCRDFPNVGPRPGYCPCIQKKI